MFEMLVGRSPFDIAGASDNPDLNTEDYLFQVILEKTIRIPRSLSVKANNVLRGFLTKNPVERLGCHSPDSFQEIRTHQFFKSIDWDMVGETLHLLWYCYVCYGISSVYLVGAEAGASSIQAKVGFRQGPGQFPPGVYRRARSSDSRRSVSLTCTAFELVLTCVRF